MAVDLSRMGLEGIETGQRTLNSIAARESQTLNDQIKLGEFQNTEEALALDKVAMDQTIAIARGEGVDISSPDATPEDFSRFMEIASEKYFSAGAPKRGTEMLAAGMDHRKKVADIESSQQTQQKTRLDNMIKAADWAYESLADAGNESEYQFILSNMPDDVKQIMGPENVQQLQNTPWSPELVDFFRTKALSTKEQASLELVAQGHRRAEKAASDAASFRRQSLALSEARHKEAVRAREVSEKASGASATKAPTTDERKAAGAAILQNVKAISFGEKPQDDSPMLQAAVDDVVGRAKQIVMEDKGVTMAEAMNRAVIEAEQAGDFVTVRAPGAKPAQSVDDYNTRYKRRGTDKSNPIPLPSDKSKMVRGRFYEKNGKVGQYGTDFE